VIGASGEASSQDILFYDYMDEYDYSSSQIAFDTTLMGDVLTERQDLISSSLGLGLLLSAVGAAIVGSLVAVGLTSLTNVRVSFHADEIGTISFPYLTLTLKSDDESIEEQEYDEVEEETPYLIEISKSNFENLNIIFSGSFFIIFGIH